MPLNKSAFLRYRIIDDCLTNPRRRYPDLQYIISRIEDRLGQGISSSMVSKDIRQMKEIYSAPIRFSRYHKGYGYTQDGFSIKEFPLTHEEIEALDMSTALLHLLKGTRMFTNFKNAINKVIEGYRISEIIGKSESQILQTEEPVRYESSRWLEPVLKGIVEKKCIKILYRGFDRPERVHEVSPYLVKEYRNRWYMIGHSNLGNRILVMALDRIHRISPCKSKYVYDRKFVPDHFFKYSFGITQLYQAKPERVVLSFSRSQSFYIISQPLHSSQKIIMENESHTVAQLEVYITMELKMAILSYGAEVEVLEPGGLRREIKATIEKMRKKYGNAHKEKSDSPGRISQENHP